MLTNISTLIQQRGIKIGEFESSVGLSAGYLSRLGKEDNKTIPSIDVIWRIAKELDVNIEWLIDGNFEHATENLEYLRSYVQELFDTLLLLQFLHFWTAEKEKLQNGK